MCGSGATVMCQHPKTLEPQCPHHCDLISRHCPKTLLLVVRTQDGFIGIAIAAQIRHDNGEVLSQSWRHPMPDRARLWMPVQEQQRGALTGPQDRDREHLRGIGRRIIASIRHPNPLILKAWKQTT